MPTETEETKRAAIVSKMIADLSNMKVPVDCLGELHEVRSAAIRLDAALALHKLQQK